jgi:hypothetical protein
MDEIHRDYSEMTLVVKAKVLKDLMVVLYKAMDIERKCWDLDTNKTKDQGNANFNVIIPGQNT